MGLRYLHFIFLLRTSNILLTLNVLFFSAIWGWECSYYWVACCKPVLKYLLCFFFSARKFNSCAIPPNMGLALCDWLRSWHHHNNWIEERPRVIADRLARNSLWQWVQGFQFKIKSVIMVYIVYYNINNIL